MFRLGNKSLSGPRLGKLARMLAFRRALGRPAVGESPGDQEDTTGVGPDGNDTQGRSSVHSDFNLGKRTVRRRRVVALLALAAAAGTAYASFGFREIDASRLSRIPGMDSTPGGARQAESEHYRSTLQQANTINADAAAASGDSFVSIPEALPEGLEFGSAESVPVAAQPAADTKQPDPVAAANAVLVNSADVVQLPVEGTLSSSTARDQAPVGANSPKGRQQPGALDNAAIEAMIKQMGAVARTMVIPKAGSTVLANDAKLQSRESVRPVGSGMDAQLANGGTAADSGNESRFESIQAGTILYGATVTTVTSDLQSPVVAEIPEGPLSGSRLLGGFSPAVAAGGLAVEFNRLATPDGREFTINAIALDPVTLRPEVASSVNQRLLERFGPGMLASLVSGFAESAARPATDLTELGGNLMVTSPAATARQNLAAGIGRAAEQVSSQMSGTVPNSPQIILEEGHPIGILFLDTATIPY